MALEFYITGIITILTGAIVVGTNFWFQKKAESLVIEEITRKVENVKNDILIKNKKVEIMEEILDRFYAVGNAIRRIGCILGDNQDEKDIDEFLEKNSETIKRTFLKYERANLLYKVRLDNNLEFFNDFIKLKTKVYLYFNETVRGIWEESHKFIQEFYMEINKFSGLLNGDDGVLAMRRFIALEATGKFDLLIKKIEYEFFNELTGHLKK